MMEEEGGEKQEGGTRRNFGAAAVDLCHISIDIYYYAFHSSVFFQRRAAVV
jgi:hypothetical protein